jgi:UDP-glucuronate 4-epimerase
LKKVLITGAAGFIGFHLSKALSASGYQVVGIDSLNEFYDIQLKLDRINQLKKEENFTFHPINITDKDSLDTLFQNHRFQIVVNLAAQAGVRFSIEKPYKYLDANLTGFLNVLEACRSNEIEHFIFASSSSVYGANDEVPFSEHHNTDHPVSLYAATKKANEMMAHSYAGLYNMPCTGLRFFTVYGPWGRPDMAYFKFTKSILSGEPISVFNDGLLSRDFTYIDDIIEGISSILEKRPGKITGKCSPANSTSGPFALFNLGNNKPETLLDFIHFLEEALGKKAIKKMLPMQAGDVEKTFADISLLHDLTGYAPKTNLKEGLKHFVSWYREYFRVL